MSTTPIIQFGTSRFLQAHADLFISEAMARGKALGPVTVVQSSGNPTRTRRLAGLVAGYTVRVRGLENGAVIEEDAHVTSVVRGLSTATDMPAIERIIVEEAEIILSNTSDAGFAPRPADRAQSFEQGMSYPAKLAHLLRARFEAGGRRIQIMPTELIERNGAALCALTLDAAEAMAPNFRAWLRDEVTWVDSLVDRIVSEPLEPAGAVAEPYALWAIQSRPGLRLPCTHPAIRVVQDLDAVARLKLFILNLGHTWLVSEWLRQGRPHRFVRELVCDPAWAQRLEDLYGEEVLPAFTAAGEDEAARHYVAVTLDRFANPFLDHPLADIAQNHVQKVERRIVAFLDWARSQGDTVAKPRLSAALEAIPCT